MMTDARHPTILRLHQVEERTGLRKSALYARIQRREFPQGIDLGGGRKGYIEAEVTEWIESRIAASRGGSIMQRERARLEAISNTIGELSADLEIAREGETCETCTWTQEEDAALDLVAHDPVTVRPLRCIWTQEEDGAWDTECGGRFEIIEATPHENQMIYCPYCGKSLREVAYEVGA